MPKDVKQGAEPLGPSASSGIDKPFDGYPGRGGKTLPRQVP